MTEGTIFIRTIEGQERVIDWTELHQLKKDILWFFDENRGQLNASFVPRSSFQSKYWEYLKLDGDKWFYQEDRNFYKQGVLIIVIGMATQYIDTSGGDQEIFGTTPIKHIINCVDEYIVENPDQERLKSIAKLGLEIANSMTKEDRINTDEYNHIDLDKFYSQLSWVDTTFIEDYYRSKLS
jgi:hypothetical protein